MQLLSFEQLKGKGIPYCRRHIERKVILKEFPAPVLLGSRRIAWVEQEVDAWIEQRIALRDQKAAA